MKVDTIKIANLVRFTLILKYAACLTPNVNKFKCLLYAINTMKPIIKYRTNTKVNVQPCIANLPINQKTIWLTTLSERETINETNDPKKAETTTPDKIIVSS